MIEILSGGILSSIQDKGRYGFRRYGVPISGPMDRYALRIANILVGNEEGAACIEVTVSGLKLTSEKSMLVAITGGDLSAQIDNKPVPLWSSILVKKGEILSFRQLRFGCRAYLAVRGGIDVPLIMDSRSTMITVALGGTGGRLKAGDRLRIGNIFSASNMEEKTLPERFIPKYSAQNTLRAVFGPQADYFSSEALSIFFNSEYTITTESDRQGYRLKGPELRHLKSFNVISEAMWPGAVEIPGDGFPIILLADAQPTGGYPKIASITSVDLDKLGQAKPSDRVRFKSVNMEEAADLIRRQENQVAEIKNLLWK